MNYKLKKVKLTESDRKNILRNLNVCTDSQGKGCGDLKKTGNPKNT